MGLGGSSVSTGRPAVQNLDAAGLLALARNPAEVERWLSDLKKAEKKANDAIARLGRAEDIDGLYDAAKAFRAEAEAKHATAKSAAEQVRQAALDEAQRTRAEAKKIHDEAVEYRKTVAEECDKRLAEALAAEQRVQKATDALGVAKRDLATREETFSRNSAEYAEKIKRLREFRDVLA